MSLQPILDVLTKIFLTHEFPSYFYPLTYFISAGPSPFRNDKNKNWMSHVGTNPIKIPNNILKIIT
jgi:hypothetical protein